VQITENIKDRIRGYLPVVVDIETGGFDENLNPMLEICAVIIGVKEDKFYQKQTLHFHITPFTGCEINDSAIKFNGIDIDNPFRGAITEKSALKQIFSAINLELKNQKCTRSVLVGHNAFFDLGFLKAATGRANLKTPFHQFSTIDTVSLGALVYGQTVLAKLVETAGIEWDNNSAHSALYDTQKTAELFCKIFNGYKK
jgi:ribonuclease T